MSIKRTANNALLAALLLVFVAGLVFIFRSQVGTNSRTAAKDSQEATLLPALTPPPSPTLNPTEIAEQNRTPVPFIVTPIPPEISSEVKASGAVFNLRTFADQDPFLFAGWSPDGSLALVRRKIQVDDYLVNQYAAGFGTHATLTDLWVIDTEGNYRMKLSDAAVAWAWSPDSKSVLFTEPVNPKGGVDVYLMIASLDSGQIDSIATADFIAGEDLSNLQWLPTGHIFFSRGDSVYRINPDGTSLSAATPLQLLPHYTEDEQGSPVPGSAFKVCPDESKIAYTLLSEKGSNTLWIANLDGSDAAQVAELPPSFEWKPDCSQLVFASIHKYPGTRYESNIMIVDRDGKNPKEVVPVSEPDEVNDFPRWIDNTNWIIYSKRVPGFDPNGRLEIQFWKVDPISNKATPLVQHAGWIPYLSTDGRWLAFNAQVTSNYDLTPNTMNAFVAQIDPAK